MMTEKEQAVIEYCESRIKDLKEERRQLAAASKKCAFEIRRLLNVMEDIKKLNLDWQ